MKANVDIKGRGSIHRDKSTSTATIHGSQEHLSASMTDEADDSLLWNETIIDDNEETNDSIDSSSTFRRKLKSRNSPGSRSRSPFRPESLRVQSRNANLTKSGSKNNSNSFFYFGVIVFILLLIVVFMMPRLETKKEKPASVKTCNYSNLKIKYPNETNYLWKHLKSTVEDMLNDIADKPGVYLFVHGGGEVTRNLIKDIANTSSSCFDSSMAPVGIESVDFTTEDALKDYGHVIDKYKERVQEGNVILIANLNEIPAEAARALHSICDTVTPLVRKVIIILSLVAEKMKNDDRAIDTAVDTLLQLWETKLESHELGPLITRVTDQVILLQS